MKENWYAFFVCIMKNVSVDKAIVKMGLRSSNPSGKQKNPRPSKYSEDFINTALELKKQGESYKDISLIMGITQGQAAGIIRYYKIKKATKNPDQSVQSSIRKSTAPLYHRMEVMQIASQM